jgi:hypothetical protein
LNNFGRAGVSPQVQLAMSPPRRSLPVRSRAPDSSGRLPDGIAAGEAHRRQTTTVDGQVDRRHTNMDATEIPGQKGGSEREGGAPKSVGVTNGDACEQGDFFLSQDKVNLLRIFISRNVPARLDGY